MSETKQEMKPVRSFQISRRRMLRASAISVPMLLAMAGKAPGAFAANGSAASMLNGSIAGEDAIDVYAQNQVNGQQNLLYNQFAGLNCDHTSPYSRGGKAIAWGNDGFLLQKEGDVTFEIDGSISANPGQSDHFVSYTIKCTYDVSDASGTNVSGEVSYLIALRVDGAWIVYSKDGNFPVGITAPFAVGSVASGTIPVSMDISSSWPTVTTNTVSVSSVSPSGLPQSAFPSYNNYYDLGD